MQAANPPRITLIVLAMGATWLIWGSTYAAIGVAVTGLPPYLMAGGRFLFAGALLFAAARLAGAPAPSLRQWSGPAVGGLLMLGASHGLVCWAEQAVPSSVAAMVMATVPVWMTLLHWLAFGGGRPGAATVAGLGAGLLGVALICAPGAAGGAPRETVILAVAPALWSTGALLMRRLAQPGSAALAAALQSLTGGAALLGVALLRGEHRGFDPAAVPPAAWLALAYLVLFGSIVALVAYAWLLANAPPERLSTHSFVNPLVALLIGTLLLDERLAPVAVAGAAAVVLGVALMILQRPRPAPAAPEPSPDERAPAPAQEVDAAAPRPRQEPPPTATPRPSPRAA